MDCGINLENKLHLVLRLRGGNYNYNFWFTMKNTITREKLKIHDFENLKFKQVMEKLKNTYGNISEQFKLF